MKTELVHVPDISCAHCTMTIENAVKKIKGIKTVHADVANKTVSLEFDESKTSLTDISAVIEDLGYTVGR